jgi:hypothetical protein
MITHSFIKVGWQGICRYTFHYLELVFGLGPVRLDVLSMGSCVWVDEVHGVVDGLVVMQTVFRPIY